jgi:hypothetical protein
VKKVVFLWVLLKIILKNKSMPLQHYFPSLKKIVILFLMLAIVVPASFISLPKKAEAAWPVSVVTDWIGALRLTEDVFQSLQQIKILAEEVIQTYKLNYLALKESVLDPLAKLLGAQLADQLVNQMFSFIKTGNSGAPSFVTNPQAYFGSVAEEATQVFLTDLKNNRPDRMASINNAVRRRITEENYVDPQRMTISTFPGGDVGYQAYIENPSECSTGIYWDCYFATLEPQNDPWQIYQFESERLAAKRGTDVKLAQDEVLAASGFHSLKTCIEKDKGFNGDSSWQIISGKTVQTLTDTENQELTALYALMKERKEAGGLPGTLMVTTNPDGTTHTSMQTLTSTEAERMNQLEFLAEQRKADGSLGAQTVGVLDGNCTEYLNKTPGDTIARQVNEYLTSQLRQIEQVDEVDELVKLGMSLVQGFMSGKGLTSVTNEVGTEGTDQGNGVITFPLK